MSAAVKTNEQLIEIIRACDLLGEPIERREQGDDSAIVDFMDELGLKQDVVSKLLASTIVMREAISRGLYIPVRN